MNVLLEAKCSNRKEKTLQCSRRIQIYFSNNSVSCEYGVSASGAVKPTAISFYWHIFVVERKEVGSE